MKVSRVVRAITGMGALLAALMGYGGALLICILIDTALSAWEIVFFALLFDFLWAAPLGIYSLPWYTIGTLALLWAFEPVRRELLS